MLVDTDGQPGKARPEKIALLKPACAEAGTITAANAASISDGAAALVMTRASVAKKLDLPIVAKVVAHAAHAREPGLFTTAPVPAIRKVLQKAGRSEEHTSELQSLMRISYAVFCLKKKKQTKSFNNYTTY